MENCCKKVILASMIIGYTLFDCFEAINNVKIKAVIFDLDGTITEPFLDFETIRREMGLSQTAEPILEAMQKMSSQERQTAQRILDYHEQKAVAESVLNDGAAQILDALRKKGIRIGILTRNTRANALAIAKKHNLIFDAIYDRDDGPVKPDAFGILSLCSQFGVKPAETLMVGDYLFDLLCANAAGAKAILLANHTDADKFAAHADFVIENIPQILEIIENCERG